MEFDHPLVGELDLHCDKLTISDTDGLLLCIFHPEPHTRVPSPTWSLSQSGARIRENMYP